MGVSCLRLCLLHAMRLSLLVAALCLFAAVHCAHRVQIGSFEGEYTSPFGKGLFVCQNDDFVQGFMDEHLIFFGNTDPADGHHLEGVFYNAGTGNCATGTFEFERTSWGMEGYLVCGGNGRVIPLSEVRSSEFRPRDNQCGLLSDEDNMDLEGRWLDENRLAMDLCFRAPDDDEGDDDDETVQGSLQRLTDDGAVSDEFVTGFWHENGRIFVGTWFEDFKAGAIMMYLRNNGDIDYTRWTGLVREDGQTYIDGNQIYDHTQHQVGTFFAPRRTSTADECTKYEVLMPFVLRNLHAVADDDDDLYYFMKTYYFDEEDQLYLRVPADALDVDSENSSSMLMASIALIMALVVLI